MVCESVVGYMSSISCFMTAVPRNRSNWVPGGSNPGYGKQNSFHPLSSVTVNGKKVYQISHCPLPWAEILRIDLNLKNKALQTKDTCKTKGLNLKKNNFF
jgi:hypothetical protein